MTKPVACRSQNMSQRTKVAARNAQWGVCLHAPPPRKTSSSPQLACLSNPIQLCKMLLHSSHFLFHLFHGSLCSYNVTAHVHSWIFMALLCTYISSEIRKVMFRKLCCLFLQVLSWRFLTMELFSVACSKILAIIMKKSLLWNWITFLGLNYSFL